MLKSVGAELGHDSTIASPTSTCGPSRVCILVGRDRDRVCLVNVFMHGMSAHILQAKQGVGSQYGRIRPCPRAGKDRPRLQFIPH